jgi:hypothetical protein
MAEILKALLAEDYIFRIFAWAAPCILSPLIISDFPILIALHPRFPQAHSRDHAFYPTRLVPNLRPSVADDLQ